MSRDPNQVREVTQAEEGRMGEHVQRPGAGGRQEPRGTREAGEEQAKGRETEATAKASRGVRFPSKGTAVTGVGEGGPVPLSIVGPEALEAHRTIPVTIREPPSCQTPLQGQEGAEPPLRTDGQIPCVSAVMKSRCDFVLGMTERPAVLGAEERAHCLSSRAVARSLS